MEMTNFGATNYANKTYLSKRYLSQWRGPPPSSMHARGWHFRTLRLFLCVCLGARAHSLTRFSSLPTQDKKLLVIVWMFIGRHCLFKQYYRAPLKLTDFGVHWRSKRSPHRAPPDESRTDTNAAGCGVESFMITKAAVDNSVPMVFQ